MAIEKWDFDPVHSSIGFTARHMVVAKVQGQFTKWTGDLQIDTGDLAASKFNVKIDSASLDSRDPQRDTHLKSADFLDVEKYPAIEFRGKRIEKSGKDSFRVTGDLKIKDVQREVVLDTEFNGRAKDPWGAERMGFTAKTKIDRKDFGLKWNVALEAGGVLVGDTVDIVIEIEAKH
jgi:polyisoprenoid-binding protein YceI